MITWNYNGNYELWQHDEFETEEECILDAKENYGLQSGDEIIIGTTVPVTPSVDIESMLERMEEQAYEECGEASENWDISSSKGREKEFNELQEKVTTLVYEYLKKIGETPSFYTIKDIHTVEIN